MISAEEWKESGLSQDSKSLTTAGQPQASAQGGCETTQNHSCAQPYLTQHPGARQHQYNVNHHVNHGQRINPKVGDIVVATDHVRYGSKRDPCNVVDRQI